MLDPRPIRAGRGKAGGFYILLPGTRLMGDRLQDQTLALAGIFQVAVLVERLSKTGEIPNENLRTSVASLFELDPATTFDVFGGSRDYRYGLGLGLNALRDVFARRPGGGWVGDLVTYTVSLIHLANHLRKNPAMLERIGDRLKEIRPQIRAGDVTDAPILAAIAQTYQDTLSTLKFRIQVRGEARFLRDEANAHKVRALLLAGVRAAILWHQVGGRRWQLPFLRRRVLATLEQLT